MIHLKALLFVAALSPLAKSVPVNAVSLEKRSVSYVVEGCFSSFTSASSKDIDGHSSNVKCQDTCRDKGYILAATKGTQCHCGNIYPKGQKVDDNQCTTRCRTWTSCNGPQSCCGGPNAYSVSVVGNIDVAKQVLRRLSHAWQTSADYRNYMKSLITTISSPQTKIADWQDAFDQPGWELCDNGMYMTGLFRNDYGHGGDDGIGRIEFAECRDEPSYLYSRKEYDCYEADWKTSFDHWGVSFCKEGYYLTGFYNSNGQKLRNIDAAKCCRPKNQNGDHWGQCYFRDVSLSFDRKGWNKCDIGYYMVGIWRGSCEELSCLFDFFCCKMGPYNGEPWMEKPDLSIKVKDVDGQLKKCSMNAMDDSASSSTYKCESISDTSNMLALHALSFNIEDKSPLNVAKPEPIPGFRPVICSSHSSSYNCAKSLATSISTSSTMSIGSGFTLAVSVGASLEVESKLFGSGTKSTFTAEVSASTSFNVESSKTRSYSTTDNTDISVQVPKNTEIMINYLRTVQELEYKWKAVFELLGKYSIKWANGQEIFQDVTTVLTGSKREMFAFGSWSYPNTDVLRVIITDKYGNEKGSGCEHNAGETTDCNL